MKSIVLAAAATVAVGALPTTASSDPATRLMSEMRAAMSDQRINRHEGYHETGTHVGNNGQSGTSDTWGDLRGLRYANRDVFGGNATLTGFDGRQARQVDPDGKLHGDTRPERLNRERLCST